ncbi:MAG: GIY-YIG nuclease family protein [Methylococcales bacterium]
MTYFETCVDIYDLLDITLKKMNKQPCVYMLSSSRNGTLYIGVTSDLIKRVYQHRMEIIESFTKRYGIHDLVWYELHERMESAILREKQLKKCSRMAKIHLIEQQNNNWQDLWPELVSPAMASGFRHCLAE